MNTKQPDIKIQVRFPHDVWTEVKRLAGKHERSFNGEVIWALRVYVSEHNEKERAIHGSTRTSRT